MNIITGAPNMAPHTRRDYTPGGLDANEGRPIISSTEAHDLLVEAHKDRAAGRTTVMEWRSFQRDIISRTVPGEVRNSMIRVLDAITIKAPARVEVKA